MRPPLNLLCVLLATPPVGCGGKTFEANEDKPSEVLEAVEQGEDSRSSSLYISDGEAEEEIYQTPWKSNVRMFEHETIGEMSCVEYSWSDGGELEVWLEPEVVPELNEEPLRYLNVTGVDGTFYDVVFVEHEGGRLDCPTPNGDAMFNIDEGLAVCPIYEPNPPFNDNIIGHEPCPCTGLDGPISLGSITRIGIKRASVPPEHWEQLKESNFGPACVADRVHLCWGECPKYAEWWPF